jgi:hypothetical protein
MYQSINFIIIGTGLNQNVVGEDMNIEIQSNVGERC